MLAVPARYKPGLRSRRKNDTVPAPPPELLVLMSVAPELSFFLAPASVRLHKLIFSIVLVCLKIVGRSPS